MRYEDGAFVVLIKEDLPMKPRKGSIGFVMKDQGNGWYLVNFSGIVLSVREDRLSRLYNPERIIGEMKEILASFRVE